MSSKKKNILPGFGISLGITIFYLSLIVLFPVSFLILNIFQMSFSEFLSVVTDPRILASFQLSFGASFFAAFVNSIFGFLVAWVLVRYEFFGRNLIDALIDLPFALPTAVAGITLATLYSKKGIFGGLLESVGLRVSYTPVGIFVALVFIGLPFIVRSIQPILEELDKESEEAARSLGASRFQTFTKIIFPKTLPALLSGFMLAFARGLGEYGSVVFISGNIPMKSEITPLLIITKLEEYDYQKAISISVLMLLISFTLFFCMNILQWQTAKKYKA